MKAATLLSTLLLASQLGQIKAQPSLTNSAVTVDIDWAAFLRRHDLIWEQLPLQWNEGAFVGNGQLGLMAYATTNDNRCDFHLGRQDVTDHRKAPGRKTSMGVPGANVMFEHPRLDVGRMWREGSRTGACGRIFATRKSPARSQLIWSN